LLLLLVLLTLREISNNLGGLDGECELAADYLELAGY